MELKLIRHLWGVDLRFGLDFYMPHWQEIGYTGLETSLRLVPDQAHFLTFLKQHSLAWIPQIFTHYFKSGGTPQAHLRCLQEQLDECLDHNPLFFNVHSGADTWSPSEAIDFYGAALELEKKLGITLSHETHRQRCFATPWQTEAVLKTFPQLNLTCDFSHWVCVCERLLPDLGEVIARATKQCYHLHARVGYEEGPQVPDPSAPEYALHLAAHEGWWDLIWEAQQKKGMKVTTLTPEFGPAGYMHTLPHTNVPVANLANVCDWMSVRQAKRFADWNGN